LFSSVVPACGSFLPCSQDPDERGSAEVRVLGVPPRFFGSVEAHAIPNALSPKGRGGSQTAATSALRFTKSREQSQNVYENKEQGQKVW